MGHQLCLSIYLLTVAVIWVLVDSSLLVSGEGNLFPIDSESRNIRSLDGIWQFRLADPSDSAIGNRNGWYKQELRKTGDTIPMPVPSSYNDITEDIDVRDHAGVVWYDRSFYVPTEWNSQALKTWLRFGGVHYAADVYLNGELVVNHEGGHIPFKNDVTSLLKYGQKNLISVAVNNTLTDITVPQGQLNKLNTDNGTKIVQEYTFDFYNYAGIHRPVILYTTPSTYIDDIAVSTDIQGTTGLISYTVTAGGQSSGNAAATVSLLDQDGNYVIQNVAGLEGKLEVTNAKLWWPYLMDPEPAYLYTLEVQLSSDSNTPDDIYRLSVGIRKLEWSNDTFTINGKPIYMRGFGRHEDSDIRGKGLDFPLIARDYNMIKWLGGNAYRTSHYPYSEEIMDFADREGIMIIDECPGVNIGSYGFKDELLEAHKLALTRLYGRDKNRPSVVVWSVSNEALTSSNGADTYFSAVAAHIKSLDSSRPITMAMIATYDKDKAGAFMDIIGVNRYNSWYVNAGRTDMIIQQVIDEVEGWRKKYNKLVIMTEYGADTMPGLHMSPEYIWSEEYQDKVLSKHFETFDKLRQNSYFVGEMIWNFADFNTAQTITRVAGNKKGVLTRERQPKSAGHLLRKRYWAVAGELDNVTPPDDVNEYISQNIRKIEKSEL